MLREHSVVVSDFTKVIGGPVFDGTLRQGLMAQLDQCRFLKLLSETRSNPNVGSDGAALGYQARSRDTAGGLLASWAAATIEGNRQP